LEFGEEEQLLRYAEEYGGYIKVIIQPAIETGARRSELGELRWENIKLSNRTATFLDTKNGDDRTIPLSSKAIEIFKSFPRQITQAFGRICKLANIEDLRFHDLRHEATSRFFEMGLSIGHL
jgi:integrase